MVERPYKRLPFGLAILPSPQDKLRGVVLIREGGDVGFLGRYVSDPSVVVEACFNEQAGLKVLGNTPLFSIIIWRGKKTLFEFFNGATVKMPSREDAEQFLLPLVHAFTDYRPRRVERRA